VKIGANMKAEVPNALFKLNIRYMMLSTDFNTDSLGADW